LGPFGASDDLGPPLPFGASDDLGPFGASDDLGPPLPFGASDDLGAFDEDLGATGTFADFEFFNLRGASDDLGAFGASDDSCVLHHFIFLFNSKIPRHLRRTAAHHSLQACLDIIKTSPPRR